MGIVIVPLDLDLCGVFNVEVVKLPQAVESGRKGRGKETPTPHDL